jgi:hypothetical protein
MDPAAAFQSGYAEFGEDFLVSTRFLSINITPLAKIEDKYIVRRIKDTLKNNRPIKAEDMK